MVKARSNLIGIGSGFKGSGKTWKFLKWLGEYSFPTDGSAGRKALIFDTNQEYTAANIAKAGFTYKIKTILAEQVPLFIKHPKIEICRVLPVKRDGTLMGAKEKKEMAWHLISIFRGGLMGLEDINNYVVDVTHEEEFINNIMNNAHRNQDMMINLQSINMINPIMVRNLDFVRMHYQTDGIDLKFKDRVEVYSIAKNIVEAKYMGGDKFFNVLIDNHAYKITGEFTQADFAMACYKYVTKQNPKLIRQEESKLRTKDHVKASAEAIKQLMRYYGN